MNHLAPATSVAPLTFIIAVLVATSGARLRTLRR